MSFFISEAVAQTAVDTAASPGQSALSWILLAGMAIFFYFVIIRPQSKRQKEHKTLTEGLGKGDEVVMTSGMLGKVISVDESYIVLKVADNVELKFQKLSVHAVLPKGTIKQI